MDKEVLGPYSNCTPARTSSGRSLPLSEIKPGMKVLFTKDHSDYVLDSVFYQPELQAAIPQEGETRTVRAVTPSRLKSQNYKVYFEEGKDPKNYFIDITGLCGDLECAVILED